MRNLHAGQEPTIRTEHGTRDLFKIGKGVHQGCILSPCLFNFEYIQSTSSKMRNYAAQGAIVKEMTGRNRAAKLEIVKQMV